MPVRRLLAELKRRQVYRAVFLYATAAWVLLEGADIVFPRLGLEDWTVNLVLALVVAGFPVGTLPIKIFNSLRCGYTPVMAAVTVAFVLLAALIFGLIGRFGDLPKLLGALNPEEK